MYFQPITANKLINLKNQSITYQMEENLLTKNININPAARVRNNLSNIIRIQAEKLNKVQIESDKNNMNDTNNNKNDNKNYNNNNRINDNDIDNVMETSSFFPIIIGFSCFGLVILLTLVQPVLMRIIKRRAQQVELTNQKINPTNQKINLTNQQLNAMNQQLNAMNQQLNPRNQQLNPRNQQLNPRNQQLNPRNQQNQHWEIDNFDASMDGNEQSERIITQILPKSCLPLSPQSFYHKTV
jgi:hypothetical protein